ncbi:helix-hairpin-helix domain-containing protein [Halococcus salifodinae]|uniref:Conjugation protein n=1 Tax=Halococcus salifodinae DSM 8989 TaxID=1227456 RepID=M0MR23_9EURY|nr:helix-hairpin-helix domain-containing protein [Halococcus salifodinae]EMA47808.1 conjugation protein [Halococcus salifodinae DSM 8989]
MNNEPDITDHSPDEELVNALSQWVAENDPLARAEFDRLRSMFVRTVGESVSHPLEGRTVHLREAEAEAFGSFACEYDVALAELDEAARYGDLHGYPLSDGGGWVPILVIADDSGGVVGAVRRIYESHQDLGDTSTSADLAHNRTVMTDGGTMPTESDSVADLNEDALVGLAADDEELAWRYKTALAPDSFKLHDECAEIDGDYFTKTLEVRDWPAKPCRGFFDDIVSFQMPKVDVTLTTHFSGENKRNANQELADSADSLKQRVKSLARNKWIPDYFVDTAVEEYADVKRTQNTISASEYSLYTAHTYIEVRAPDRDRLDTAIERIQARMQDVSAAAKELKYHPKEGYQTVAPACKNYLGGQTKMTGDGLARLMPWTASNLIEPGGIELGTNEDTGDPIILDLQNRETGFNVGVWGTIGSGKTTTLTRLLLRLKMKNPEMPLVIIDPKQEFAGFTWLFDGQTVKIGSNTGINPLQIEETPPEDLDEDGDEGPYRNAIRRAMDFVRSFYEYQSLPFEDVQDTWRDAIKEAYSRREITKDPSTHHRDSPTLKEDVFPILLEMLNDPEEFVLSGAEDVDTSVDGMEQRADKILHQHTGALQEGGEFEHLSEETSIDINNIDVLYLDLQNYENEVTAGLMMGPLLTSVLEQAKEIDEPMALAMDEFHYMLHNSSSLETLKQAYRHSRHSDLSMITATQSVEEFFTKNDEGERQLTDDASTLTNLMSVKIWHYLEEMNDEWADEFDLTDAEQRHVEDAATGEPTAQALLTLQKGGSYRLAVDYTDKLTPREFAVNQYDPTEAEDGTDPLAYLHNYTDRDDKDVTEWTWLGQDDAGHGSRTDQSHTGTELADGTTVTTDVADVDVTPTEANTDADAATDSPEQARGETPADEADGDESATAESEIGSDGPADEESAGFASRLKDSVSEAVGRNDQDKSEAVEDPELTDIHGTITVRMAGNLRAAGYGSVEDFFEADNAALAEVEGLDVTKAAFLRRQAAEPLGRSKSIVESPEATDKRENAEIDGQQPEEAQSSDSPDADESADTAGQVSADESGQPALTDIQEIGDDRADMLREAGFETVEDVATANESTLTDVKGIGGARAATIVESASSLVDEQAEGAVAGTAGGDD